MGKRNKRKRILALARALAPVFVAALVLSLCACGKSDTGTGAGKNNSNGNTNAIGNANGNGGKETTQSGNNGGGNGSGQSNSGNNGNGQGNNGGNGDATQDNNGGKDDGGTQGNDGETNGGGTQGNNGENGGGNDSNSGTTDTSGQEANGLQVVIYSDTEADFIIENAYMEPGENGGCYVEFSLRGIDFNVMLSENDEKQLYAMFSAAMAGGHGEYCEYGYIGNQLTLSVMLNEILSVFDDEGFRFSFYDIEEYTLHYYKNGYDGGDIKVLAADVVTNGIRPADSGNSSQTAGVGQDAESEFPCKPEILYGIRDARFMMDVSGQTEADGWQEYWIFFEMNGENCCVSMVYQRFAEYPSYFGGGNVRAANTEKTELEAYKYAEYAADARYDEETGKMYVDISGLIGGRFLDIEQYTVRHIHYDEGHHKIVEEKTFAASEVARLNYTPASDFKYEDDGNGGIVLTGFTGNYDLELIIPREIDGKPVTAVGYIGEGERGRGFSRGTGIMVPDSVKTIGDYCFQGARTADLILPEGLTEIGKGAFSRCNGLTEITLPSTVTYIGARAFYNCENLHRVVFPDGLETISEFMFEATPLREVILPKNLKTIEREAFAGRPLESITFPEGLESIGYQAFYQCKELKDFTLPDSLTDLGEYAFADCVSLIRAAYPKNMTVLNSAYEGCSGISSFTIPEWVTEIGDDAFRLCGLTSIRIPDGVTRIGDAAFVGTKLTSVTIPEGVTSIGSQAFAGCEMLTSVILPESVTSIEWGTFDSCRRLTSINIPDSVTSIGDWAFFRCSSLRTISLPSGVELGVKVFEESPTTVTYR